MSSLRIIDLPTFWTVLLDIAAWFIIHMGVVAVMVSLPVDLFDPDSGWFRPRGWERGGRLYDRLFRIRAWKDMLPDGADILRWRSFRKKHFENTTLDYLELFARETCRAELTHLATMVWAPFFFLWNPVWVGWLMIVYALGENIPLILAQRYNRARLQKVVARGRRRRP